MRKSAFLIGLIILALLAIGMISCDAEPARPPKEDEKKFEPYSFAVITDLHIGYDIPDYFSDYPTEPGKAWLDGLEDNPSENDKQVETLSCVVERIINEKDRFNIKFVAVLGDISDTAEKSEFLMAREILNRLNDTGIPYIPLMGNHDTWPYTQKEGIDPDIRGEENHATIADYAIGDEFFEEIFWGDVNNRNIRLLGELFGDSWQKGQNPISDLPGTNHFVYLQNYGFSYQEITFVALDLNPRAKSDSFPGGTFPLDPRGAFAVDHPQTIEFSQNYTKSQSSERNIVILFSHHPLGFGGMVRYVILEDYRWIYNFAGHWHTTEVQRPDVSKFGILTEDIGEINFPLTNRTGKPIRIVQVKEDKIDYSVLLSKECPSIPTVAPTPTVIDCPAEGEPKFSLGQDVITTDSLKVRENPGFAAREIKTQPRGTFGKILEGPICADNYIWWKVEYQDGIIGWSAENWLGIALMITPIPTIISPEITPYEMGKLLTVRGGNLTVIDLTTLKEDFLYIPDIYGEIQGACWSPDGKQIALAATTDPNRATDILIFNPETQELNNITEKAGVEWWQGGFATPVWSPDGSRIVFWVMWHLRRSESVRYIDLHTLSIELVAGPVEVGRPIASQPTWSPDGRKIAFYAREGYGGEPGIYITDISTGEVTYLTSGYYPSWSPDGSKIAFAELSSDEIYYIEVETKNLVHVSAQNPPKAGPYEVPSRPIVWSPDASKIAFINEGGEIHIIDLKTKADKRIAVGGYTTIDWWAPR